MTHHRLAAIFGLMTLLLSAYVSADAQLDRYERLEAPSQYAEAISLARQDVQALMDKGAPGVSVAVGVAGEIVWSEGFGYANVEHRSPVTPLTVFRVGSVAKAMTTIAMGILMEEERIDIDAPIQNYLPDFPENSGGVVTARLLASHRGGVRHYLEDGSDYLIFKHYNNVEDALEVFIDTPYALAPDQQFSYTSHGYNLLSAVLQSAADEEYLGFMDDRVLAPMKLLQTVPDQVAAVIDHRAAPYQRNAAGKLENAPFTDNSYKWAGGGYLSTPEDLVRFGFGVLYDEVINAETRKVLWSRPVDAQGRPHDQDYGLGWFIYPNRPDGGWVGHSGGSVGGNTVFQIHPQQEVVVALVCNLTGCLQDSPELTKIGDYFLQ